MAFRVCQGARTFSSFLATKIPAKTSLSTVRIHSNGTESLLTKASCSNVLQLSKRYGSYYTSPFEENIDKSTIPNVKIEQNPPEWKYVEQVLAPLVIPQPTAKASYPSGWKPPKIDPSSVPYFIGRTRNHMIPVYLVISFRGMRRQTKIHRIQGDIWKCEAELREFLEDYMKKKMSMRVNEYTRDIILGGDYVNLVKHFLTEKGF